MNFASNLLRVVGAAAVTVMLMASMPSAQAVEQTWSFNGTLNSSAFSGSFSFDDATAFTLDGFDPLLSIARVDSLSMNYMGSTYSLADAGYAADVSWYDGSFLGLSVPYIADLTFVAGTFDASEAFVTNGPASADVIYAPVPEPQSYAMLLAGLGLLAFASRRWVK